MFRHEERNHKSLYLTNNAGDKLLKLVIKKESTSKRDDEFAQIKIIRYGIKRAYLWLDKPKDPYIISLHDNVEITYHGAPKNELSPKIHIKASSGYKTLVNDSLQLPSCAHHPIPLFSFESGYANKRITGQPVTKSSHTISTEHQSSVRFDLYLSSAKMDMKAFGQSAYFFNLFWNMDYLAITKHPPLSSGLIIAPITLFPMGSHMILVRRSISGHTGRPYINFYSNKNYYSKMMDRPVAYQNDDGTLHWSTLRAEDDRLLAEFSAKKI